MKKFIFGFFIFVTILCLQNNFATTQTVQNLVRVGISDNNFKNYYYDKISFTSDDDFLILDSNSEEINFKSGQIASISLKNGFFEVYNEDSLVLKTENNIYLRPQTDKSLDIIGLKRKSKQASYSGTFELIKKDNTKFAVVNVLPLQTYLKGVVPNEMPVSFGLEALKAQAILARNYVLKPRSKYYKEFDICDSVACQVYFGANTQEALSNKAVDETENIVVLYNNDLILAVYSSTTGGFSESYKNVFLQNIQNKIVSPNIPYLVGVSDNNEIKNLSDEKVMREFYSSTPETFDNNSPYFRWKREWTVAELEDILKKTLISVKNTGFVKTKYDVDYSDKNYFGKLRSIFINKRGDSGKIVALTLITDKNEFTLYKELIIRKVFLNKNSMLPSANVFFDFVDDESTGAKKVVATGGGLGHGVGMSQWGAGKMAKIGYKYNDIIHHYYKDVKITSLPVVVMPNSIVTQEFFMDTKNACLKFDNKFYFSDLNIIINNKDLDADTKNKLLSDKKSDVSHYIKHGKNVITFEMISGKNNKPTKFWIESE